MTDCECSCEAVSCSDCVDDFVVLEDLRMGHGDGLTFNCAVFGDDGCSSASQFEENFELWMFGE